MPIDPERVKGAVAFVERDVREGFGPFLTAAENNAFTIELTDSSIDSNDTTMTSDSLVAVPWVYRCAHTGPFLDVPATYVDLELRGVSFVDVRGQNADDWTYHRYIDYIGALHQLGVQTTNRPALDPEQYENWNERRPKS